MRILSFILTVIRAFLEFILRCFFLWEEANVDNGGSYEYDSRELIEILQVLDEDTEIRMASQPNWPFEYSIAGVTTKSRYDDEEDDPGTRRPGDQKVDIAFIVEGEQLCYGSKKAFDREYRICV